MILLLEEYVVEVIVVLDLLGIYCIVFYGL